ncbi:hypothetical protein B0I37DRAFT_135635 [Chaetomium sp. MPI-CAGE-AT-0009]|nr:hypothetical protein B0I37DRAFT_135635 [Chaetomium sp. MPI-CAGE-AT-0009]
MNCPLCRILSGVLRLHCSQFRCFSSPKHIRGKPFARDARLLVLVGILAVGPPLLSFSFVDTARGLSTLGVCWFQSPPLRPVSPTSPLQAAVPRPPSLARPWISFLDTEPNQEETREAGPDHPPSHQPQPTSPHIPYQQPSQNALGLTRSQLRSTSKPCKSATAIRPPETSRTSINFAYSYRSLSRYTAEEQEHLATADAHSNQLSTWGGRVPHPTARPAPGRAGRPVTDRPRTGPPGRRTRSLVHSCPLRLCAHEIPDERSIIPCSMLSPCLAITTLRSSQPSGVEMRWRLGFGFSSRSLCTAAAKGLVLFWVSNRLGSAATYPFWRDFLQGLGECRILVLTCHACLTSARPLVVPIPVCPSMLIFGV